MSLTEGTEELRHETTEKALRAMADIAANKDANIEHRIKAAHVVAHINDSILQAQTVSGAVDGLQSAVNGGHRFKKQIDDMYKGE